PEVGKVTVFNVPIHLSATPGEVHAPAPLTLRAHTEEVLYEMGYSSALTAKTWGFYDVLFRGKPFRFKRPYGSYVMEHILFKISFPAEFHAQTAVECAVILHPRVTDRLADIEKVVITTHDFAISIIDKQGPLSSPADRDHCIQYMTAIGLIKGNLTAADYEDSAAADPRVDRLRAKMTCIEHKPWSRDYLDPGKRSIANAAQVFFKAGTKTEKVAVEYPVGHRRRRKEGIPLLAAKFRTHLARRFPPRRQQAIISLCADPRRLEATPVNEFTDLFVT
ncbi:MAG: MmgE/PrpD family protein, partial [Betaproteobacteria bacterium]|nr:MmgE/PrpD family protein [Betaproteobacteria bacterium]